MNIVILDEAWIREDVAWKRQLGKLLIELSHRQGHSLDADGDQLLAWCQLQIPLFAEQLRALLAGSNPRTNACELTVDPNGVAKLNGSPPWRVTAEVACSLVQRPLRLFLENDDADWAFLCAVANGVAALKQGDGLEVVHGGGSTLATKISAAGTDDSQRWRSFFIFDSDRLHAEELIDGWKAPNGDGCEGQRLQEACRDAALPLSRWRMLRRRSIENYLPESILMTENPTCASALLSPGVGKMRLFYNMKKGLDGDGVWPSNPKKVVRAARSRTAWDSLRPEDKDALKSGFGPKIAEKFKTLARTVRWDVDVVAEADEIASALFDAL